MSTLIEAAIRAWIDKRAHARESSVKELMAAIMHLLGVPPHPRH
jgi:hypothetical protein